MTDVTDTEPTPDEAEPEVEPEVEVDEAPDPHALDDAHADLLARLEAALGDAVLESASNFGTPVARIRRDSWRRAAEVCRTQLECDYLSFISGIDWMPTPKEGGTRPVVTRRRRCSRPRPPTGSPGPTGGSRCSRTSSRRSTTPA